MVPRDTGQRDERSSRAVPFDPEGRVWALVRERVIVSTDVDERMKPCVPGGEAPASPPTPPPPPLPYQRQVRPPVLPPVLPPPPPTPPTPPRAPLGSVAVNVLRGEVRALEAQNAALAKLVRRQDHVISGFCALYTVDRENVRP